LANEHTIKTFTTADIEKYHKGLLSPKEMHDLEKAALDDPFLADALEGYTVSGVNMTADLAELKERLSEKTEKNKVVPMALPRKPFPWLRAAALVVLIAGAGFLVYQLGFNKEKENYISQAPDAKQEAVKQNAPASDSVTAIQADSNRRVSVAKEMEQAKVNNTTNGVIPEKAKSSFELSVQTPDSATTTNKLQGTVPGIAINEEKGREVVADKAINDRQETSIGYKPAEQKKKDLTQTQKDTIQTGSFDDNRFLNRSAAAAPSRRKAADTETRRQDQYRPNIFRGIITDSNNNALPFANVTNTVDNVGTYSDAKGNFVLTSPDSVLNVQVRSIGFQNNTIKLQHQQATNQVIMQEDNSLSEVVINNQRANSNRDRRNTIVVEEPEPIDGWTNYDIYIANNINLAEAGKTRRNTSGEVKISFEVDAKGQPINIIVDKSLCESCDKEAIRLVKEGPKWKRKAKKSGRTSVSIFF
jgi:hypothetical protein